MERTEGRERAGAHAVYFDGLDGSVERADYRETRCQSGAQGRTQHRAETDRGGCRAGVVARWRGQRGPESSWASEVVLMLGLGCEEGRESRRCGICALDAEGYMGVSGFLVTSFLVLPR